MVEMWRTCLFFLWRVAGVWGCAAVCVACSIMRLCKGGHRPQVSNQPLVGTLEGVCRWEPSIQVGGPPVGAHRIPEVCVEGGAGVYEVELCPEDLLFVLCVWGEIRPPHRWLALGVLAWNPPWKREVVRGDGHRTLHAGGEGQVQEVRLRGIKVNLRRTKRGAHSNQPAFSRTSAEHKQNISSW